MRTIKITAAFAMALGSVGCVGSLTPDTGDDTVDPPITSAARQMFEAEVSPMLSACSGCHVGAIDQSPLKFLGNAGPTGYYDALIAEESVIGGFDPGLANMVNKGQHDEGRARAWTDAEKGVITSWLLAEADERGIETDPNPNPGNTTPTTSREALAQWSACMSIDDWNASQVYLWADKGSERGQCMSCHNQGAGGFFANDDATLMFDMNRYEIYITTFFTASPIDITNPSAGYQVLVNEQKLRLKANAAGHPAYNPDGGDQMDFLYNFYNLTKARLDAGTCNPGGFPETPPPA
jgi:mono/diheme cytochrome c family protein